MYWDPLFNMDPVLFNSPTDNITDIARGWAISVMLKRKRNLYFFYISVASLTSSSLSNFGMTIIRSKQQFETISAQNYTVESQLKRI